MKSDLSRETLNKLYQAGADNNQATIDRANSFCRRLTFPDEHSCLTNGLQVVNKSAWTEALHCYRVKHGICKGMFVISSYAIYEGQIWHHVSFSLTKAMPSYDQMVWIKKVFVPDDLKSLQVLPATAEHVNIKSNCLHLWSCLESDFLPDFRTHGHI
jgi:hypothetical protein